ncbi:hypothetical protein [uncultured Microscilla sp.]|uniref:hypothetical protein n=1 Tax=uncultured Microscilla sp. TaxID=432653 RepID=UPI002624B463|nr:hypothetical protein [uncultured Microscilla sp.]
MTTINGNFRVNGVPFADWFNQTFRLTNPQIYSHFVNASNFTKLMGYIPDFTGKQAITLAEFCGHFAIMYNETGGTFTVIREMGGPKYMFEPTSWGKVTYNKAPNKLAGDQLKQWGIISSELDVAKWNGHVYPGDLPNNAQNRCDFYRYRGYGFNQLTWRNNYEKYMQPALPKPLDDYEAEEFETAINSLDVACKTFHNFISQGHTAQKAIANLTEGSFEAYGMLVSGGWVAYVNHKYTPRALNLYNMLKTATITPDNDNQAPPDTDIPPKYAINGMHLTPQQIKIIQQAIINSGNTQSAQLMKSSGGADGIWGNSTEKAFQLTGKTIQELLKGANDNHITHISGLSREEVKGVQQTIIDAANLVAYNGGADGIWGKDSAVAFAKLARLIEMTEQQIQKDSLAIGKMSPKEVKGVQKTIMTAGSIVVRSGGADGFWGDASESAYKLLIQKMNALFT